MADIIIQLIVYICFPRVYKKLSNILRLIDRNQHSSVQPRITQDHKHQKVPRRLAINKIIIPDIENSNKQYKMRK